jgi:hypothetical protein
MRTALLFSLLLVGLLGSHAQAQTVPIEESQKAVLAFELRLDMLRDSELGKSLNLKDQIGEWAEQQGNGGPDPTTISRIFGVASAPESMEAAQGFATGQVPIEFSVKIDFVDAASADAFVADAKEKGAEAVEKNGKTYYRPTNEGSPEGVVMHLATSTTVEMGTDAYVFNGDLGQILSSGLGEAWKKVPDDAIRMAMDLEGAKDFVAEAVAMGQENAEGMTAAYLGLVDNAKNIRFGHDLSSKNILTLQATCTSESDAEELRGGLDSMLGMAQMGGGMMVGQLNQMDPAAGAALKELLDSLKATSDGAEVGVVVPKPAGFDDAVKSAAEKFGLGN